MPTIALLLTLNFLIGCSITMRPNTPNLLGSSFAQDVTVIFRRRGGDDLEQSHALWATSVRSSPDVIEMTFFPITALLDGVAGKEHLARAIGLYLECKAS